MNILLSCFLLILLGFVANFLLLALCVYLANKIKKQQSEKQIKNDLYKQRCKHIHQTIRDYYYTYAITQPSLLASEIADKQIEMMKRKQLIDDMYKKLKAASN